MATRSNEELAAYEDAARERWGSDYNTALDVVLPAALEDDGLRERIVTAADPGQEVVVQGQRLAADAAFDDAPLDNHKWLP